LNSKRSLTLPLAAVAAVLFFPSLSKSQEQKPAPDASGQAAPKSQETPKPEEDPFAPQPAPPLPEGMSGSDVNDPRAKLKPGMYDAGEIAKGMKHVSFVKKPNAFQLQANSADDPSVQKVLGQLGVGSVEKMPKALQMVIAQLAFANSDFAFQGNHLFQGNFYGVNIYDISNPAKASLLTSMVCPGGQGDVSVYGNLMFMSVEMPNGRIDCGAQGFPPEPAPAPGKEKWEIARARVRRRIRTRRCFVLT
jgi:hypothetical protein